MRIVFVRHGHPNYANDCLTELGHEHAAAAAERLRGEGICEIHSSTCGRAVETAQHTADLLGLKVTSHDFIRELTWGSRDGSEIFQNGHPWFTAEDMIRRGVDVMCADWHSREPFCQNRVVESVAHVAKGIDRWLAALGYEREGAYYRATGQNTNRTVAMFSHAGSSTAAIAHLFNLPFPYLCTTMELAYTAITVVRLSDETGVLAQPQFEIACDARHIQRCEMLIGN